MRMTERPRYAVFKQGTSEQAARVDTRPERAEPLGDCTKNLTNVRVRDLAEEQPHLP
jgi:hypothetical protein